MKLRKYRLELDNRHMPVMVTEEIHERTLPLSSPQMVVDLCNDVFSLGRRCEEHVVLLAMGAGGPVGFFELAHGQVAFCNLSAVEPLKRLLLCGTAVGGIIVHNHPSGNVSISDADRMVCGRLNEAFQIVGMDLQDFIILSGDRYVSFKEENLL